jgi:hypothetical protein
MTIDERIAAELRRHAPQVDEHVAWDRIRSAAPAHRRSRALRLVAMSAAALGFVLLGFVLLPNLSSGPPPASAPQSPFLGTWVTTDFDGSTPTMVIQASEDEDLEILAHDDFASVCSGAPSTMIGTGGLEGSAELVIPSPVLTCDDGSQPEALSGPPLEEQLQNLTFTHDPGTDTLTDNFGSVWTREDVEIPSPEPTTPPLSEAEVTELLNGFLEARIAGEAAKQYLEVPEEDIPLLYATSSGAPYERAEFEPVLGIEWPYGWMGFKVRLFAGETVVEQLFFTGRPPVLGLDYQPDGFATDIAPTTEDGQPVAVPYSIFDGEVTLLAAHPWVFGNIVGWLIPEGPGVGPTTDGGERRDWDHLVLMADIRQVAADCQTGPVPVDAEALAESIRSYPDLEATAPVAVNVGGTEALMMDVKMAAGAGICVTTDPGGDIDSGVLSLLLDLDSYSIHVPANAASGVATGFATGDWMRLYLFDAPEGSSMRILTIAIIAPEASFERAVEAAAPVVESVEIHAP